MSEKDEYIEQFERTKKYLWNLVSNLTEMILRSLKFRFPMLFNRKEIYELDWDNKVPRRR